MRNLSRRLTLALNKIDIVYLANENKKTISDAEYCFMYALDDALPHSQKEISEEWLIPKTTINSIAKKYEREGYINFSRVPGARREMMITLTDVGCEYVKNQLDFMYRAEEIATRKTVEQFGEEFIGIIEAYGKNLKEAFATDKKKDGQ